MSTATEWKVREILFGLSQMPEPSPYGSCGIIGVRATELQATMVATLICARKCVHKLARFLVQFPA